MYFFQHMYKSSQLTVYFLFRSATNLLSARTSSSSRSASPSRCWPSRPVGTWPLRSSCMCSCTLVRGHCHEEMWIYVVLFVVLFGVLYVYDMIYICLIYISDLRNWEEGKQDCIPKWLFELGDFSDTNKKGGHEPSWAIMIHRFCVPFSAAPPHLFYHKPIDIVLSCFMCATIPVSLCIEYSPTKWEPEPGHHHHHHLDLVAQEVLGASAGLCLWAPPGLSGGAGSLGPTGGYQKPQGC